MDTRDKLLRKYVFSRTTEALEQIESLSMEKRLTLLNSLPIPFVARLLETMDQSKSAEFLHSQNSEKAIEITAQLSFEALESILRITNESEREALLLNLDSTIATNLRKVLRYPKTTVGALIDPNIFSLLSDLSVEQSLESIKGKPEQVLTHIFVVDRNKVLKGLIALKKLIGMDGELTLGSIMNSDVKKVIAEMEISALLKSGIWPESYYQLPVVNSSNIFLGGVSRESIAKIVHPTGSQDRSAVEAGNALGDLYQIGLTGIFKTASELF